MKVTKRVGYALRLLAELAGHGDQKPVTAHEVARRHGISEKYLWLAASSLHKAGIVDAVRGPLGGFRLARPAAAITLGDVIEACDGSWVEWLDGLDPARDEAFNAVLSAIGHKLAADWSQELRSVTLETLLREHRARQSELVGDFQI
ncbi:MAG: Rrf2 family transcriptional regulator [Kiritimatiellae bacterium]|nr:Rrf2 family transcriptional regulator [Kiritimatiellia bacterium]